MIADTLASEYGWTLRYVLESLYIDDVRALFPLIRKRQISELKMQLSIAENPHKKDPEVLWRQFDRLEGKDYLEEEQLDKTAFLALKQKIAKGGGIVVK